MSIVYRPRRLRATSAIRNLVRENSVGPGDLIWPVFVVEGQNQCLSVKSMPGVEKYSVDVALRQIKDLMGSGLNGVALFPAISEDKKDTMATESFNPDGLSLRAISQIKAAFPDLMVFSDVAMDPFSSDGHDGIVKNGKILNDESLEILAKMALAQAKAGADWVAPSDMMDGRVAYIREALDANGFQDVGILSYAAKYCSSFYGPFREALDSAPRAGDKKTYQMDPANSREALKEAALDEGEGADMLMVKPAGSYLDIIYQLRQSTDLPVAAYQVSGEYSMIQAVASNGWMNGKALRDESLVSIKRAGADVILSYFTREILLG